MSRAEVGTSKYVANKMRSKGFQRLRWYFQVCEKQCCDENGFKCHTQAKSHIRNILAISNLNKKIEEFSREFKSDFIKQLRYVSELLTFIKGPGLFPRNGNVQFSSDFPGRIYFSTSNLW